MSKLLWIGGAMLLGLGAAGTAFALGQKPPDGSPETWEMVPNPFGPKQFQKRVDQVRYIVIHHSHTSTPAATIRALNNRGASTHFEVDQTGHTRNYLDPATIWAYSAGWINRYAIAIDVTHAPGAPWPEAQVAATARLVAELRRRFPGIGVMVAPENPGHPKKLVPLYTNAKQIPKEVGILRHRNAIATECPQDFPMARLGPVQQLLIA